MLVPDQDAQAPVSSMPAEFAAQGLQTVTTDSFTCSSGAVVLWAPKGCAHGKVLQCDILPLQTYKGNCPAWAGSC